MGKEIRALYITYDGVMDPLGQSQVIPYLLGLTSLGNRVILLSFEKPHVVKDRKRMDALAKELNNKNIYWSILRYHKRPTLLATFYDIIKGFFRTIFLSQKFNIDFIHARSYIPAFIAYLVRRLKGTKFIFDMRGLWADERVDGGIWPKHSMLYKVVKKLEKTLLLNSDRTIVLTHQVKDIIENFDYMKNKRHCIDVIPTCVDLKKFHIQKKNEEVLNSLGKAKGKFILFYLGSIGTWYMLRDMIDFFIAVKNRLKESYFLFLANNEKKNIEDEMKKHGVPAKDFSVRNVPHLEVAKWLSVADASIFFIKPCFSKKASCATKFGESLACGIPVVVNSGIGDADEIIRSNRVGVIIDGFDPDLYQKGIEELLNLSKDKDALRKKCRDTARKLLSLDEGINQLQGIYKGLIEESQS